ncbi:hypothetical protein P7K49_007554 [Saguinus oedipus]|uniref:Uncharacterized protein n=1 Tax=Saguinus oedipus TaxID=9490 RepID=A0ABQ9VXL2_SAGOE|nr:hypothetical protein P7K49_007554 [Saguinus oedipus]
MLRGCVVARDGSFVGGHFQSTYDGEEFVFLSHDLHKPGQLRKPRLRIKLSSNCELRR